MNKQGLLLVISGPSGVGKGTVVKELMKMRNDMHLSVSATTRQRREGEEEGVNYYFMSEDEFIALKKEGGFLETAAFCQNYYGTPKKEVFSKLEQGINVILEIEVQGAMRVREKYPEGVFVYLMPPSMRELRARLTGRNTESKQIIEERLKTASFEFAHIDRYNYIVINDTVQNAARKISCIIEAENARIERNIGILPLLCES